MLDSSNPFSKIRSLHTAHCDLLHTTLNDFESLFSVAGDPAVWVQHPERDRWRRDKFERFFKAALDNPLGCFTVMDRAKSRVIGSTRYYGFQESPLSVRIGYTFFACEYWGASANREVKKVMLAEAFALVDLVFFDVGATNYRSRAAVEKLGARLSHVDDSGTVVYALDSKSSFLENQRT